MVHLHFCTESPPQHLRVVRWTFAVFWPHSVGIPVIYWELPPLSRPWRWRQRLASAIEAIEVRQTCLPSPGSKNTACDSDLTNAISCQDCASWEEARQLLVYSQNRLVALLVRSHDSSFSSSQLQLESSVSTLCSRRVTAATKLKTLAPWNKSYDKPRQCIKKQRNHFVNKVLYSLQAMVFPVGTYSFESWTMKKTEHQRTDAFELWGS